MSIAVPQLQSYINAGLNIIITGPAGTGKTAMLKEACDKLGLRVKYYSASTLDPFADLVGIPVPDPENKRVEYYRPRDVDEAEVVFADELNRADSKTLNALFEMIQFRSINGEPLPKLKCVVAAINPVSDEYDTDELDLALLDRFDIYLEAPVEANRAYFTNKYGRAYAMAGIQVFDTYQKSYLEERRSKQNKMGYFSPRRLDKLMEIFRLFPKPETIAAVLPADVVVSRRLVATEFTKALGQGSAPTEVSANSPVPRAETPASSSTVEKQLAMSDSDMRKKPNASEFLRAYEWAKENDPQKAETMRKKAAKSLAVGIGPSTFNQVWKEVAKDFTHTESSKMKKNWPPQKILMYDDLKKSW